MFPLKYTLQIETWTDFNLVSPGLLHAVCPSEWNKFAKAAGILIRFTLKFLLKFVNAVDFIKFGKPNHHVARKNTQTYSDYRMSRKNISGKTGSEWPEKSLFSSLHFHFLSTRSFRYSDGNRRLKQAFRVNHPVVLLSPQKFRGTGNCVVFYQYIKPKHGCSSLVTQNKGRQATYISQLCSSTNG